MRARVLHPRHAAHGEPLASCSIFAWHSMLHNSANRVDDMVAQLAKHPRHCLHQSCTLCAGARQLSAGLIRA